MDFLTSLWEFLKTSLDIALVWLVLHYLLSVFRNNARTIQIFKGIIYVLLAKLIADTFKLTTFTYLLNFILNWGFLAIIVIFQPEIRSILEKMGRTSLTSMANLNQSQKQSLINELVEATMALSATKTGALITIQRKNSLEDYIKAGKSIQSLVSKELLTSIFVTTTPLHDGAVIIVGNRIACASTYFPSSNNNIPSRFGSRHRAALGISEVSDALTIVVSEETGSISVTQNGKFLLVETAKSLYDILNAGIVIESDQPSATNFWSRLRLEASEAVDRSQQSMADLAQSQTYRSSDPMKLPQRKTKKESTKHE